MAVDGWMDVWWFRFNASITSSPVLSRTIGSTSLRGSLPPFFLGARAVRLPFAPCVRECRVTLARRGNDQLFPLRLTGLVSTLLVAPARVGERVAEIDCMYRVHVHVHICMWTHPLPVCTHIPAHPSTAPAPKAIRDRRSIVTVYFIVCLPCLRQLQYFS